MSASPPSTGTRRTSCPPPAPVDLCEHCGERVHRVWLVPGDVYDSCATCYADATGRAPVHSQGHSSAPVATLWGSGG